jgi:multimeric flavodoxin WrbA
MREVTVAGIVASPRKGKNTDRLVAQVLEGCRSAGAHTRTVYLDDLRIAPCRACKEQDGNGCVQVDGMQELYRILEEADGIVLGTPVYYNTVSAQMKLMIDRCYCLARPVLTDGRRSYVSAVAKAKKGIVVSVGGSGTNPECVLPVFELWAPEVNLEIVDRLLATRALAGGEPMASEDLLAQALRLGESLVARLKG